MIEIRCVLASAAANAPPFLVLAEGEIEVFEGSTDSGFLTMFAIDNSGRGVQWRQPRPELALMDDLEEDIAAGLAALDEPVAASWESVKERLGL